MVLTAGSWVRWSSLMLLVVAVGCGGGSTTKDAGKDGEADGMGSLDVGTDHVSTDTTVDAGTDMGAETGGDTSGAEVGGDGGGDTAGDTATEVGGDTAIEVGGDVAADMAQEAGGDAIMDAPSEEGPPVIPMLIVDATVNSIVLDRCTGLMPATLVDVAAGAHTVKLTASTLSKGKVSAGNDELPSFDDFVIVNVPIAAGDPASRRFFMLNGVGTMANFTLSAVGTVKLLFIDSDAAANTGQGTVTLDTTGATAIVDATTNVLPWNTGCFATPVSMTVTNVPHRLTLVDSTLSSGGGSNDDYVLLRLPSERPMDPYRYVILNGVGSTLDFTPYMSTSLRAWFISPSAGATGRATVTITDL